MFQAILSTGNQRHTKMGEDALGLNAAPQCFCLSSFTVHFRKTVRYFSFSQQPKQHRTGQI